MGQTVSTEGTEPYPLTIPNRGTLTGYTFKSPRTGNRSCVRFAKVPYAQPVSGDNRWRLPKPLPADYDYTGDYKEFGLKCPQPSVPDKRFQYIKSPSDENITYLNIWIPYSDKDKPEGGWPVLLYLHGGWLQYNSPNSEFFNPIEAFDDDEFTQKYVLVVPGYRLNMFGFLSGKELLEEDPKSSNFGFWDQRLAMEWAYENIKHFGGNPEKITVGGLSAGAYSTFFQLCYELYHPEAPQLTKQVAFFSNLVYVQPKTIEETQGQFDEIIEKLGVSNAATTAEKMAKLRSLDSVWIEEFIPTLSMHTFRAVTDGNFISPDIIKDLVSGKFAKMMVDRGIKVLSGEVDNEGLKYSLLNTPQTIEDLPIQVENYYPRHVADELLKVYSADELDPADPDLKESLRKKYGAIIGDGQVYASQRGFLQKLVDNGYPEDMIYRYRVSYRADWLDKHISEDMKVPHACDFHVWFYDLREGYTEKEREIIHSWLLPYLQFLNFEDDIQGWQHDDVTKLRYFKRDGSEEYVEDPVWDWGCKVANAVYNSQI